jgi:hypothetical protein
MVSYGYQNIMKRIPDKCKDVSAIGSFCDCIVGAESVDVAAWGFCRQSTTTGSVSGVTGDALNELKKALKDLAIDHIMRRVQGGYIHENQDSKS